MSLASRIAARMLQLPPATVRDLAVERDLAVPMPDGVVLRADRYYSRSAGPAPVLLVRTPYGRRGLFGVVYGELFAERGLQVLVQSCRGTADSGGEFEPFLHERADGLATVTWLLGQPWCSGELATAGASYLGFVQWALAREAGPALRAMAVQVATSDFRDQTYPGETFSLDTALSWSYLMRDPRRGALRGLWSQLGKARALRAGFGHLPLVEADLRASGEPVPFLRAWLAHNEPGSDYWARRGPAAEVAEVAAPVHLIAGWDDIFTPWQLADYQRLRAAGRAPYLTVGPWTHTSLGSVGVAARETLAWTRTHLLGERGLLRAAPVRVYVTGAEEWRDFSEWPPPGHVVTRFHLQPDRGLAGAPPPASPPDVYRYDPAEPTPAVGGPVLGAGASRLDNRALEARSDVLTYTTPPLERDLEAIGPVRAELFVKPGRPHADFFARVCDVDPAGRSINVCDGIVRVVPGRPAALPDGTLRLEIALWPTAHRFRRGHRLRLQVSSGAHPRFARNPGSGEPLASARELFASDQAVYHDPERPSALLLPVVG